MEWKKSDLFCPACGSACVYENDMDDYYYGCDFVCIDCEMQFNLNLFNARKEWLKEVKKLDEDTSGSL